VLPGESVGLFAQVIPSSLLEKEVASEFLNAGRRTELAQILIVKLVVLVSSPPIKRECKLFDLVPRRGFFGNV